MKSFPLQPNYKHARGMRYLFLNIDGVLHPVEGPYNMRLKANVLDAVKRFNFQVVITSDWRESVALEAMKANMGELGQRVVGMTPIFSAPDIKSYRWFSGASTLTGPRQLEIEEWLFQHTPGDSGWVALDSHRGNFVEGCESVYFTNPRRGLDNQELVAFRAWCTHRFTRLATA